MCIRGKVRHGTAAPQTSRKCKPTLRQARSVRTHEQAQAETRSRDLYATVTFKIPFEH